MLMYAHLQRHSLPPSLEALKEKILVIYPVLAEFLLMFLADVKHSDAMEAVIQYIQAIKQAIPPSPSPVSHHLPCQHDIPHLAITREAFYIWGQTKIYTDSRPYFSFRAMLYPSEIVGPPPFTRRISAQIGQDKEQIDVDGDVLMNRKSRKDAGGSSVLQPAYTPYYPEVTALLHTD